MAEPMRVFGVVRERTVAERETAEAAGATLLVGRDAELALLLERWAQSQDGRGQVVLVSGEAGIGKPQPGNYPYRAQRITGPNHHRR